MNPIWLSTADVGELVGLTPRQVRNSLRLWEYRWTEKNGKKVLEINLRSLPKDARDRYVLSQLPELSEVEAPKADDTEIALRAYEHANGRAKKNFDKWTMILTKCDGITGTRELERFVASWNEQHPQLKTSVQSIYRQRSLVAECGKIALINHQDVMGSTVKDLWFEDFRNAYLTANKLSVFSARMIAMGFAMQRGDIKSEKEFPSKDAFRRRLNREVAPDVIYFAREGKKKFYDNKGYHLDRDYSDLTAGSVWVGDTRTWDVFVKVPGQEKPATCYITLFLDFKTYMPMGWCLHHSSPSTENTLMAMRNGIEKYGLPEALYVDNGREYRNRDFSGQSRMHKIDIDEQYADSLATRLGIKMHFAIVRNARAKVIERQFLVIKNGFDRLFNSFKGGTVVEKPEPLKAVLKSGDFLTWDEFSKLADNYLREVFPGLPCLGKNHEGKSRAELWNEEIVKREPMKRVSKETLAMITSRTVSGKIVHMGFHVQQLDAWYWAEWMPVYKGREVTLRYDPEDMRIAWCYDSEKKLIGECVLQQAVGAMVDDSDAVARSQISEGVARKNREERLLKELVPEMTKGQAEEYIGAMRTAVGKQDIFIPQGPMKPTRHDSDSAALAADRKIGNSEIINLLSEEEVAEEQVHSIWDDLTANG